MRVFFALLGLAALPLSLAHGNPIAIDAQRRPAAMVTEAVMFTVDQEYSTVSGRYSFRQEADDWPEERDTHVLVYVPVLLSRQAAEQYEKRFGVPVVMVNGRKFFASIRDDLAFADSPTGVSLPRGWFMQMYEVKIPLRLVSKVFEIEVRYIQPNFPGRVAGYVPIRPPKNLMMSKVAFQPIQGFALRPVGFLSIFAPRQGRLEFSPQDRKLIAVRLQKQ